MTEEKNIIALIKNIESIKSGRLKIEANSLTETDQQLIQIIKADKDGYLHFFVSVMEHKLRDSKQKFYANLIFQDKKEATKIQLSGYVCEEINTDKEDLSMGAPTLLHMKFKIMQVEIIEFNADEIKKPQQLLSNIINLFWKYS